MTSATTQQQCVVAIHTYCKPATGSHNVSTMGYIPNKIDNKDTEFVATVPIAKGIVRDPLDGLWAGMLALLERVSKELTLKWNNEARVEKQLTLKWNNLLRVSKQLTLIWNNWQRISKQLTLKWNNIQRISKQLTLKWNNWQRISKQLTLKWDNLQRVGGWAILLDGSSDDINCGTHTSLWSQQHNKFSLAFWFKILANQEGDFINHNDGDDSQFSFRWDSGQGGLKFVIRGTSGSSVECVYQPVDGLDSLVGKWVHFAGTFDESLTDDENIKIFVYGIQEAQATLEDPTHATQGVGNLIIGDNPPFWYVKDLRFWTNNALTQTQMQKVKDNDPTAPTPSYWLKMLETTGNPVDSIDSKTTVLTNGLWKPVSPQVWVEGKSLTLKWNNLLRVSKQLTLKWDDWQRISKQLTLKWNNLLRVSKQLILKWNVEAEEELERISKSLTLRWNNEARVSKQLTLKWDDWQRISKQLTLKWNNWLRVSKQLILKWDDIQRISKQLTLKWDNLIRVSKQLTLRWNNLILVSKTLTLKWNTNARVSKQLILKWHKQVTALPQKVYKVVKGQFNIKTHEKIPRFTSFMRGLYNRTGDDEIRRG